MSRGAYGFGLMKSQLNTIQSLLLTEPPVLTPTLQQVLDAGDTAQGILTINAPPGTITNAMRYDTQIISDAASNTATHQTDGFLVTNQPFGADYGQLLKDRIKFQNGATLIELINNGTKLDINGQVDFNTVPHSPDPVNGNDLANKGYVDALIGNYSGSGLNLFLNYSQPSLNVVGASILSTTVSAAALQTVTTTALGAGTLIASFATPAGFPNLNVLPIGLWQLTVYGFATAATGTLFYKFNLYQQPLVGVKVLITSSGDSADVNATNPLTPNAFFMSAPITSPFALALTDVLLVEILTTGIGMGGGVQLNTVFEDGYYSFVNTNLSGGTSLLTTNNNWSGTNKFALALASPALDTATAVALNLGTTNATPVNIGRVGMNTTIGGTANCVGVFTALTATINVIQSTGVNSTMDAYTFNTGGDYNLLTGNITGPASLFGSATRTATLNIQNNSFSANIINIGSATSATNIRGLRAATLDSITSSVLSVGSNVLTTGINLNNKVLSNLTRGVNQFVSLSVNTTLPASNQLGYINTIGSPNGAGFVDNANFISGTTQEYGTIASLPAGVYMVSANLSISQVALTTLTKVDLSITATGNTAYSDRKAVTNGAATATVYTISGIFSRTSVITATTCTLTCTFTGTAPKMSQDFFKFNIVRIA